jgi:hypothetical protein
MFDSTVAQLFFFFSPFGPVMSSAAGRGCGCGPLLQHTNMLQHCQTAESAMIAFGYSDVIGQGYRRRAGGPVVTMGYVR